MGDRGKAPTSRGYTSSPRAHHAENPIEQGQVVKRLEVQSKSLLCVSEELGVIREQLIFRGWQHQIRHESDESTSSQMSTRIMPILYHCSYVLQVRSLHTVTVKLSTPRRSQRPDRTANHTVEACIVEVDTIVLQLRHTWVQCQSQEPRRRCEAVVVDGSATAYCQADVYAKFIRA